MNSSAAKLMGNSWDSAKRLSTYGAQEFVLKRKIRIIHV